jgi:hypothetical protein
MSELDQNTNSNQEGGNHKGKCNDKFIGKSKSKGKVIIQLVIKIIIRSKIYNQII